MIEISLVKHKKKKPQTEPGSYDSKMKITWDEKTGVVDFKGIIPDSKIIINIIKIVMIGFFSIYVIGAAAPYYVGADSLLYGIAINLFLDGSYEYTNELMEMFEGPFSPAQFAPTVHGTVVPSGSSGIIMIGIISFLIGGEYGLFYVGPIATVLLFILTERITTKFFGGFAGLIALILVGTDYVILNLGKIFLTDNIFALFAILGGYYLVKFFHKRNEKYILFASIFFSLSALMRMNGMIFFPVEILLVSLYFLYLAYSKKILNKNLNYEKSEKNTESQKNSNLMIENHITKTVMLKKPTKIFKISFLLLIPWLIFFLFFFSYNSYYFGDPLTTYVTADFKGENMNEGFLSSFRIFDSDTIDWIKYYSIGTLPDRIKYGLADLFSLENASFTDTIGFRNIQLIDNNWVGIFTFVIILTAIGISFIYKTKRIEVIVLCFFILGTLFFYTTPFLSGSYDNAESITADLQERYMLSNFVLVTMLFSFVMIKIYEINFEKISISKARFISKGFKIIFLLILGLLLFVSFYYSMPMSSALGSTFTLNDPKSYVKEFPYESGLPEKSIIITPGRDAIKLDKIPFHTNYLGEYKEFDQTIINDNDIQMLIDSMDDGYTVYTFKQTRPGAPQFFRYLEAEHGLILKNFSISFCKMERLTVDVNFDTKSDDVCYGSVDRVSDDIVIDDIVIDDIVNEDIVNQISFELVVQMIGGTLKNSFVDVENLALIINIESNSDGSIMVDLPRKSFDAKKADGTDDIFVIIINEIEVPYQESQVDDNFRRITIDFKDGDSKIEIFGTFIGS